MSQPLIMSFAPDAARRCLDGRKTETRRVPLWTETELVRDGAVFPLSAIRAGVLNPVSEVRIRGRKTWRVGESCAIKPSRTARAVGRVEIERLIIEPLDWITENGARHEGVEPEPGQSYREAFFEVWDRLYPRGPKSREAYPLVVVIGFRPTVKRKNPKRK